MAKRDSSRMAKNKSLIETFEAYVGAIVTLLLLFTFVVRVVQVDGNSMNPNLWDGEKLIITSFPYTPEHGDIVVTDSHTRYGKVLIKRVIGCPGDTIDIDFTAGTVYRNGEALSEPYTAAPTYLAEGAEFPLTVPAGQLFLMGDNRNDSLDSRSAEVGLIDTRDVLGKVLWRLLPFDRMGAVP